MSDIKSLINIILSDEKLKNSKSFSSKVYDDEPILRVASQMKNYCPQEIRDMKKLAYDVDVYSQSSAYLFYRQGKLMENYEDDYEYHGEYERYFPTYQTMNDLQLRGYFSWRTKLRHGNVGHCSLSFAFVYIYELLNQIGVSSPEDGFLKLLEFRKAYAPFEPDIERYLRLWLNDYVVYYGLDKKYLDEVRGNAAESAIAVLHDRGSYSRDEIFGAIKALSSYSVEKSAFFKKYPEDSRDIICNVYDALSDYFDKHRKKPLFAKLFGEKRYGAYYMFNSAIFYDRNRYENYEYVVNNLCRYLCIKGCWFSDMFYNANGKNKELGAYIKTTDSLMRSEYGFKTQIDCENSSKIVVSIISKEIKKYLETKKASAVPEINIDISKLGDIRSAAEKTRDKLIVDDEPDEILTQTIEAKPSSSLLDDAEYRFMSCLLYGGDIAEFIRQSGLMLSVLVDSVNEKLFDSFGDTVIVFDGDTPELLDDYIDELKKLIFE